MKKFILIMSAIMVVLATNICAAMSISQPVKIGEVHGINLGGHAFKNATSVHGNIVHTKTSGLKIYGKGIATFGDKDNNLNIHFKHDPQYIVYYGGKDLINTVSIQTLDTDILKLETDSNICLYLIHNGYDMPEEENYTLIGERQDGRFVKYIDLRILLIQYLGNEGRAYFPNSVESRGDTIIFKYRGRKPIGEIRCKWDDNAQWFSVENVVY